MTGAGKGMEGKEKGRGEGSREGEPGE